MQISGVLPRGQNGCKFPSEKAVSSCQAFLQVLQPSEAAGETISRTFDASSF